MHCQQQKEFLKKPEELNGDKLEIFPKKLEGEDSEIF